MANLTPKLLYLGNGDNSNVYSSNSNANSYTIIKNINICNTTAVNTVVSIHLLVNGAINDSNNKIISNVNITANNVTFYNTSIVMPSNSSIFLDQAGSSATVAISGVEYVA